MHLEPNEFSYKMFINAKQITSTDLAKAIPVFKQFWTKEALKKLVKKFGFIPHEVKVALLAYSNPLVKEFTNSDIDSLYIKLRPSDIPSKYMKPEEYQFLEYTNRIVHICTINNPSTYKHQHLIDTYLNILNRMPKSKQSKALIKYLKLVKETHDNKWLKNRNDSSGRRWLWRLLCSV